MAALLTTLGEVVTAVMTYIGTICTTIVGQPLLLMTTGFLLIGGCIGIFGRLLSKGEQSDRIAHWAISSFSLRCTAPLIFPRTRYKNRAGQILPKYGFIITQRLNFW